MGKFKETGEPKYNGQTEIFNKEALKQEIGLGKTNERKNSYAWGFLRPAVIFLISLAFVVIVVLIGIDYINTNYLTPVDRKDTQGITIEIKRGSSVSAIADLLYKNGLIKNRTVFKFYVDFSDMTSKLKAGNYILNKSMSIEEIMYALSKGDDRPKVTKFTVTEGMTIEDMAKTLQSKGIIKTQDTFKNLCKNGTAFFGYPFIADLDPQAQTEKVSAESNEATPAKDNKNKAEAVAPPKSNRTYLLEGYLFPDTYEIYTDSTEEAIIQKMLNRFSQIFNETYLEQAEDMNMTIDQVITMASIIEREGKPKDFKKLSAVFHNRIAKKMKFQSDATLQYILKKRKFTFTEDERNTESPYNTYKYYGLPIGPISNPGKSAIEAALYPDEQYLKDGYLYFCTSDPEKGELVFAKTPKEHEKNVAQYRPLWVAYDQAHGS